jgi:hypothetical protein
MVQLHVVLTIYECLLQRLCQYLEKGAAYGRRKAVIPAKAGIQGLDFDIWYKKIVNHTWIPAFAGMTGQFMQITSYR